MDLHPYYKTNVSNVLCLQLFSWLKHNILLGIAVFFLHTHTTLSLGLPSACLRGPTGSTLDHRSLPPEFASRCGHIWRVFQLWLVCSVHLAYHVPKYGRKMSIIILAHLYWPSSEFLLLIKRFPRTLYCKYWNQINCCKHSDKCITVFTIIVILIDSLAIILDIL